MHSGPYDHAVYRYEVFRGQGDHLDAAVSGRLAVSLADGFVVPDESGASKRWRALTGEALHMEPPRSVYYVLLEDETGCPRGAGNEGSIFVEAADGSSVDETRSRYTDYFLGNAHYVQKRLDQDGLRETVLIALGMVAHGGDGFDALSRILNATLVTNESAATFRFADPVSKRDAGNWTITFEGDPNAPAIRPSTIRWTHRPGSGPREEGVIELESVEPRAGDGAPLACDALRAWDEPRAATRWLSDDDVPYRGPVPADYPMADAYSDARADQNASEFFAKHPDARLMGMLNDAFQFVTEGQPAKIRQYTWYVTFASPADGVLIEVQPIRHGVEPVGSVYTGSRVVRDESPVGVPFGAEKVHSQKPLLSADEALALAAEAGLAEVNRLGWGEPPYWSYEDPFWWVGYHHPEYGTSPTATRTYFFFNAETGWLLRSAINVAPQG